MDIIRQEKLTSLYYFHIFHPFCPQTEECDKRIFVNISKKFEKVENKKPPLLSQHEVYKYQSSIRLNIPASHCEAANEK